MEYFTDFLISLLYTQSVPYHPHCGLAREGSNGCSLSVNTLEGCMKTIHLDGIPSRSITISDEGYEQIVPLIMASRCCRRHGCAFSESNPVVGVNVCLGC